MAEPRSKSKTKDASTRNTPRTRIQKKNREAILNAALEAFSEQGFRGATLDRIAAEAGLSKPNLLYYFASKEAIYLELLGTLMDNWLDPLRALDPNGDPVEELVAYVQRKLQMSRDFPRESRLFAQEIVQGAPHILPQIQTELRDLVDGEAELITSWINAGLIAPVDPHHLIFSIWSTTQHYADFDTQVTAILGKSEEDRFAEADAFLVGFYRRALAPETS